MCSINLAYHVSYLPPLVLSSPPPSPIQMQMQMQMHPPQKKTKQKNNNTSASLSSVLLGTRTCSLQCGMWAGRPRSDHSGGTTLRTQTDSYTWWIRTTENEPRRQRKSCNGFASKMNSGTALCKFFYATTQGRGIFILTKTYSLRLDSIRLDDIAWV